MHIVILAGGVGTRLWPRSRQSRPKQFSDITGGGRTMIQATVDRISALAPVSRSTSSLDVNTRRWLLSSYRRFPNRTLSLSRVDATPPRPFGSSHHLPSTARPKRHHCRYPRQTTCWPMKNCSVTRLRRAAEAAQDGYLVTVGIEPDFPHTGMGYIKRGEVIHGDREDASPVYVVERFLEKPNPETAQRFLAAGGVLFERRHLCISCRADAPRNGAPTSGCPFTPAPDQERAGTGRAEQVLNSLWDQMPNISIDYAVVEGARAWP